jgi:uncharacterized protein YukE
MPRFAGEAVQTEDQETKKPRFGGTSVDVSPPKSTAQESVGLPPLFDEGLGYVPAPAEPNKMPYSEQMSKLGTFGKEYLKGTAALAAGTPAEFTVNLPSTLQTIAGAGQEALGLPKLGVPQVPRVGYGVPEASKYLFGEPKKPEEKAGRFFGETFGLPTSIGAAEAITPLLKAIRAAKTGEKAEDVLASARGLGEELTTAAKEKGGKELLSREIAMKKEMARPETIPPEVSKIHEAARSENKFLPPDTAEVRAVGKDLNSDIRRLSSKALTEAEERLATGGEKFKDYLDLGKKIESQQPVAASPAGQKLNATLSQMSTDMSLTPETRVLASTTKNKLFPKNANEAFNTFDVEYRRLINKAEGKADVKIDAEDAAILRSVANPIEQALKDFVGKENYARPIYAEEAKDINKFRKDLGEALASRERGEYDVGKGEIVSVKDPAKVLFADRRSVDFGRQLLGEAEVNSFAERHAINQLNGKSAKEISEWLNKTSNDYVYEVPGLWEKIQKYGQSVARGEGDAKAYKALQDQWSKHLDTIQKEFQGAEKTINNAARKIAKVDPAKLETVWLGEGGAPGLRSELEGTKLFAKADLDALENKLLQASQIADAAEKKKQFTDNIMALVKLTAKKAGLPVGALGIGYELFKD